jgi:hypothetical protein
LNENTFHLDSKANNNTNNQKRLLEKDETTITTTTTINQNKIFKNDNYDDELIVLN